MKETWDKIEKRDRETSSEREGPSDEPRKREGRGACQAAQARGIQERSRKANSQRQIWVRQRQGRDAGGGRQGLSQEGLVNCRFLERAWFKSQIEGEVRPVVTETNGIRRGQVASSFFPNLPAIVNGRG